jgi:hypothetical protein
MSTIVAIGHYKRFALFCTHMPLFKKRQGTHLNIHAKPNHKKVTKKAIKFDNNDKWVHDG